MKGYRTLGINLALAILPVIQMTGAADLGLTGHAAEIYSLVVTAINFGLRFLTSTPVGQKESQ